MENPNGLKSERNQFKMSPLPDILGTSPDERFERLTRVAKRLLGVPIAFVSLLDEGRQWFDAWLGPENSSDTLGNVPFCGHATFGNEIFIVPNASEDKRFADDPVVLGEPHVRFYAGCPLRDPEGRRLGTLCIIDRKPRRLCQEDLEAFADLASMAECELAALQLATKDDLTDLSNRRGFVMLAQQSLQLCARQGKPASLVFMDLDGFKQINDTFGHAEGDFALNVFAKLLKGTCRGSDLLARLGGDEFVVLLANTQDEFAEGAIARFAQSIAKHNRAASRGYDISFSYGIVEFTPEKHSGVEALLAEGDALMYAIKHGKK